MKTIVKHTIILITNKKRMKNIIFIAFLMCFYSNIYSQDFTEAYRKMSIENDSLKKIIKANKEQLQGFQNNIKSLNDTIKTLRTKLTVLEEFRADKEIYDHLIKEKTDSISFLKEQILLEKTIAVEEYKRGKHEIQESIINTYKNKKFDDLIISSTKMTIERDIPLIKTDKEIKAILSDIEKYFNAKELLGMKYNTDKIKNATTQLNQINRESGLVESLKKNIENYSLYNNGLREIIEKILALDETLNVFDMPQEIQKNKLDKILSDISSYIFNYDFNFTDYPYLSDIVLEIIKRKQPNPDADISDLLKKL